MKIQQPEPLDAIPSKRLFLSIIADYDLNRAICELIDNAIDSWVKAGKTTPLKIEVDLDENQQSILIRDNAGGVKKDDMKVIVGPGQTTNLPTDPVIGIFGVGTKRAVIALAQEIRITTRHLKEGTYQVEFDDSWIKSDESWKLPLYEVDTIDEWTTIISLKGLRIHVDQAGNSNLKTYISETYARFLKSADLSIIVNHEKIQPKNFENWAYPPDYQPRRYFGELPTENGEIVNVEIIAGLSKESSPTGEYGVYFYCNDRLIAKALKSYEVGFSTGQAGQPHSSISLTKVFVSLKGNALSMPWNSSKSAINYNHHVFLALRDLILRAVKENAFISRAFQGDWPEKVFKYNSGQIVDVPITSFQTRKSYLPPLPVSKPRYEKLVKQANCKISKTKPWTTGLYEGIIATDLIFKEDLEQKNRICLILLDSTLEIAFKEYLVNDSGVAYSDKRLLDIFSNRIEVQKEISNYKKISLKVWKKIDYYYKLRCKLVHERATVSINDGQIKDYRCVVESVLKILFNLQF
jgi:hypothetical protein